MRWDIFGVSIFTGLFIAACQPYEQQSTSDQGEWHEASDKELAEFTEIAGDFATQGLSPILIEGQQYPIDVPQAAVAMTTPVTVNAHALETAAKFRESLETSQARLAAYRPDQCPKLLATEVDSNQIIRTQEILKSNYCDYFIYPLAGDRITVESKPDSFQANLISPINHDFINGNYLVKQTDKHVIRLTYKGIDPAMKSNKYGITVSVNKQDSL